MGVAAASACLPKVILEVSLDGVLRAVVVQPSQEHLAIGDILPRVHVAPAMCGCAGSQPAIYWISPAPKAALPLPDSFFPRRRACADLQQSRVASRV